VGQIHAVGSIPLGAATSEAFQRETLKRCVIMMDWLEILKESLLDWLLEKTNPSIRYFTLRDILGKGEDDPQVVAAKQAISISKVVKRILSKQNPEGS